MLRVCVYCGSSFGSAPGYREMATAFGAACAARGHGIVYGGGSVGLMGALADGALAAGGEVAGIIPRAMIAEERGHRGLTELVAVDTMHERKYEMARRADAFVALPGGIGTLEEITEVFTWLQLGLHVKPVGLLNFHGFYDPLLRLLDGMVDEGFLIPAHRAMLAVETDPARLLDLLETTRPVPVAKPVYPAANPAPVAQDL